MLETLAWSRKGLWRAMYNHFTIMEKATNWALGNGRKVKFWLDNWIGFGGNLLDIAIDHIPNNEKFN